MVLSLFTLACASTPTRSPEKAAMPDVTIDHVMVGIADLEQGIRLLSQLTGVAPERGGQHPGRGTQNALLSLGPHTYLELIAPAGEPTGEMKGLVDLHALTPIGWAIGTKDLTATKSRLEAVGFRVSAPRDGSRLKPDGQTLRWRTAALEDVPGDLTPFLIEWSAQTPHPAKTSPGGCMLASLDLRGPKLERLTKLVTELRLGATVHEGTAPEVGLTLDCPAGRITLGSSGH
jgi:hypothetical protein